MDNYKEYLDPADGYALVKQPVNMPVRPHWIDIPEGADCLMQWPTGHKVFYRDNFAKSWNSAYREWQFVSGDDGIDQSSTLWKRATQDPDLICGADALRALADGKSVEWQDDNGGWWPLGVGWKWNQIVNSLNGIKALRLKPQTIKVELELPKPFEPKDGDECFIFDSEQEDGFYRFTYGENSGFHKNLIQFGAYRTEAEVKQVVDQLRKIRGAS
ncbi:hypothetical protein [Acinetobacter nosocomialis]|uniref:hypothetical protein n=1 Tax=Acinetobacter nosocomialis TaxID=106654 RepID=UPI001B81C8E2|nr:hypothetical protein [Acinetobacter nosocomialis]MBR7737702.1 hypothetical protein [Acinetobacter nosocomialis]